MRTRGWWVALALIGPLAVLAWLAAMGSPAVFWVVLLFWAVIVVGVVVRVFRGARRGGLRGGLGPVADGLDLAQDIYLSRPRPPVTYGADTPDPDLTLYVDAEEEDPGDLRGPTPAA
jgi:hypothetical protein